MNFFIFGECQDARSASLLVDYVIFSVTLLGRKPSRVKVKDILDDRLLFSQGKLPAVGGCSWSIDDSVVLINQC